MSEAVPIRSFSPNGDPNEGRGVDPRALLRSTFFEGITLEAAEVAARVLKPVHLTPGQTLFKQDDPSNSAYLLVSGRVDVKIRVQGQPDRTIANLEAESILGEMGLLLGESRTASVVARTEAALWEIPIESYEAARAAGEPWSIRLLSCMATLLARRVQATDRRLVELMAEVVKSESKPNPTKMAELEQLRNRLFTHWSF